LKTTLDALEAGSPGLKAQFLFGFLDRHADMFAVEAADDAVVGACETCGMPTTGDVCAFCRQRETILSVLPVHEAAR